MFELIKMKRIGLVRFRLNIGGVFDLVEKGFMREMRKQFQEDFLCKCIYLDAIESKYKEDIEKLKSLKKRRMDVIFAGGTACIARTWDVFKDGNVPVVGWGYMVSGPLIGKKVGEWSGINLTLIEVREGASELNKFIKEILPDAKYVGIIVNKDILIDRLLAEEGLKEEDKQGLSIRILEMKPDMEVDKDLDALCGITGAIEYLPMLIEWRKPIIMTVHSKYDKYVLSIRCPDPEAGGKQAAEIVCDVLRGKDISKIPIRGPGKYKAIVNLDVARKLGLEITSGMLKYQR